MSTSAPPHDPQTLEPPIPPTCLHLSALRSISNLNLIPKRIPKRPLYCSVCGQSPPRLFVCVTCRTPVVTCRDHVLSHAEDKSHNLAVDVDRKELFCCVCLDQVYDRAFDAVFMPKVSAAGKKEAGNLAKRRRVGFKAWSPDAEERALISENSSPMSSRTVGDDGGTVPRGLRGLSNLGNTCFMNSVLQALLHTMPLRDFFLASKHDNSLLRLVCEKEIKSSSTRKKDKEVITSCLVCDLDVMVKAVFGMEDTKPYTPAKFLYSCWQHSSQLASYEQQDAHEFFMSVINVIHDRLKDKQDKQDKRKSATQLNEDCGCIAHRVFYGKIRSDVTCSSCGSTSTKIEQSLDISLDLEPDHTGKPTSAKSSSSVDNKEDPVSTLTGCLDMYTRPEKMGVHLGIVCSKCKMVQECVKQMSIRKLPLVCCFYIKRYQETSKVRGLTQKNNRYLQFPFFLDMAPYLSSAILRRKYGNRMGPVDDEQDGSTEVSTEFELFAVVSHKGSLDAGHYVTYLRFRDEWYKCDDSWITRVDASIVRSAQGYMMFYVQKMLYYAEEKASAAS